MFGKIMELLGKDSESLLKHECKTVDKSLLHLPGPDFVDRIWINSDRSQRVLTNLQRIFDSGRLGGGSSVRNLGRRDHVCRFARGMPPVAVRGFAGRLYLGRRHRRQSVRISSSHAAGYFIAGQS